MNRWLAGHVFWPLSERALGRDTMTRYRGLQHTSRFTREQLDALQATKLRELLTHAEQRCPFYRERFAQHGFAPADITSVRDLQKLPTLTREDIRRNREAMVWADCPGGPRRYATGGSSGEPLIFYTDSQRQAADWAARFRARSWWGVRPGDPEILLWGAPTELCVNDRLRQFRDALLNQQILSAFDMTDVAMAEYVRRIRELRPACLYGYASSLGLLARYALDHGIPAGGLGSDRLRAVFVTGEVLQEHDKTAIETAFGVPPAIEYGARDAGLLAYGCPAGRLHVPMENVMVEVVDSQGRPVPAGELGEVAITYLETRAMPLIRYRPGDLAIAAADPCPCGRRSQCLLEVRGRVTDGIVRREGDSLRRMHALSLMYVLREAEGLRQFRIVQPSLDRLEVDVAADERFTAEVENDVLAGLTARMGPGVDVRIRRCDRIPPNAAGKHACVISHVVS